VQPKIQIFNENPHFLDANKYLSVEVFRQSSIGDTPLGLAHFQSRQLDSSQRKNVLETDSLKDCMKRPRYGCPSDSQNNHSDKFPQASGSYAGGSGNYQFWSNWHKGLQL